MICNRCGAQQPDDSFFCASCGNRLTEAPTNNYQNSQMNQPVYVPPYSVKEETQPVTTIGQYILWALVGLIPLVGFILTIVFAVDSSNKNRANFFRAQLILMAIGIVLSIIMFIVMFSAGMSMLGNIEEFADILTDLEYYL